MNKIKGKLKKTVDIVPNWNYNINIQFQLGTERR